MITPDDFKLRFQEFACKKNAEVQIFLDDAIIMLNDALWGTKYDLGLSYLTAHYLALSDRSASSNPKAAATSGPVSAKSVDGVSLAYASHQAEDDWEAYYSQTSYGQRYLAMMKTLPIVAIIV